MTFVDFDICHQMASLRKLYTVTLIYVSDVKDSNRDLPTVVNAHLGVRSTNKDSN